jgi:pimeloyl-ACP methyl ester carboxylesterase
MNPGVRLRVTFGVVLLSISNAVLAVEEPTPPVAEDQRLLPYTKPGQLIDVGGRRINMHCEGTGSPTVVLMAGLFSWSLVWYKTQPLNAKETRVCAFDRAAYGWSDPPPQPQLISEVLEDLHKVLHSGSIRGPYVLVGHSLGGVEARVYAQRWPEDVVGMVLLDTSPAGEGLIDEAQPDYDEAAGREGYIAYMLHCADLARSGAFRLSGSEPTQELTNCSADLTKRHPPQAFKEVWPRFFPPQYFEAKASLLWGLYNHQYDSADHHHLGAMPLVVLSIEHPWGDAETPAGKRLDKSYGKIWNDMHADLARLSSRGVHRVVKDSSHEIALDQPHAVIEAVNDVVKEVRAGSKS